MNGVSLEQEGGPVSAGLRGSLDQHLSTFSRNKAHQNPYVRSGLREVVSELGG